MEMLKAFLPIAGILFIIMGLYNLRAKKRRSPQKPARDQLEELKQRKAVKDDLTRVMIEVEELTRRFSSQIDAKTIKLERMIQEAEVRIDQLRQLQQQQPTQTPDQPLSPGNQTPDPAETTSPTPPMTDLRNAVHQLADDGLDPIAIAEKLDEHVGKIELILALRSNPTR
ncbi:hypothetical protein [Mucisphaera calidilacus]|uniref:DUF2802 domain-containing protein n=1 Tax=Mucisphaera calidilacus TaxID=2527982 RepID=A0A518BTJ9_9BACT|nr:hypothetical protein [Mucisphaera calidilacus]QDU70298.1 hypothetical protein Pan265_01210 [Mucisphaera calidilacus]